LNSSARQSRVTGRRLAAVLVLGLAAACLVGAGVINATQPLVGSPSAAATTVVQVATSPSARHAIAVELVAMLGRDAPARARADIVAHRARFVAAVETALGDPTVQLLARQDLTRVFTAATTGAATTVDFRPLIDRIALVLHRVERTFPARPRPLNNAVWHAKPGATALSHEHLAIPIELALVAVGAILDVLAAAFLVRRRRWRAWAVAAPFLAAVAFLAAVTGACAAVGGAGFTDAHAQIVARAAAARIGASFRGAALLFAGLALGAVVAWDLGGRWRRRRERRA